MMRYPLWNNALSAGLRASCAGCPLCQVFLNGVAASCPAEPGCPTVSFVLLFFSCLITLIEEVEVSLNYSPAITGFSHKELLKLPQGLSVGTMRVNFMGGIAEKWEKPTSWSLALFGFELWLSVQIYSRENKRGAGLIAYDGQLWSMLLGYDQSFRARQSTLQMALFLTDFSHQKNQERWFDITKIGILVICSSNEFSTSKFQEWVLLVLILLQK